MCNKAHLAQQSLWSDLKLSKDIFSLLFLAFRPHSLTCSHSHWLSQIMAVDLNFVKFFCIIRSSSFWIIHFAGKLSSIYPSTIGLQIDRRMSDRHNKKEQTNGTMSLFWVVIWEARQDSFYGWTSPIVSIVLFRSTISIFCFVFFIFLGINFPLIPFHTKMNGKQLTIGLKSFHHMSW